MRHFLIGRVFAAALAIAICVSPALHLRASDDTTATLRVQTVARSASVHAIAALIKRDGKAVHASFLALPPAVRPGPAPPGRMLAVSPTSESDVARPERTPLGPRPPPSTASLL